MHNVALKPISFGTFSSYITTDNRVVGVESCEMNSW